jgi:hypothetical protein
MFGRFKPVPFEPYGRRRSRFRLPRWLVLLLLGIASGALGVVVLQERYLPPRLSADASARLRAAFEQADADRSRLQGQLADTTRKLDAALADKAALGKELEAGRATTERLRKDLGAAVAALPPDPRGGSVEVRAGQFSARGGVLSYDVVLTRERSGGRVINAVMQFVVSGDAGRGSESTATLEAVPLSIGAHEVARGSVALPAGFNPRQATIRILDRVGGNQLGMRVMLVK